MSIPSPDPETAASWLREQLGEEKQNQPGEDKIASSEVIEDVLESSGNRPLEALAELQSGKLAGFTATRQLLLDLLSGAASVQQTAVTGAKIGDAVIFEHIDRISTILIRGLVTGVWRNSANEQLARALPGNGARQNLPALLEFHKQVARARKLLAGQGNQNPQFMLESIFLHWQQSLAQKSG